MSTVSPGKLASRSISAAQRAAPTVDVKVKRIEASGMRLIIIDIVPKLYNIYVSPETCLKTFRKNIRNVSALMTRDECVALHLIKTFKLEVARVVGWPGFPARKEEEDGSANDGNEVEGKKDEVLDDRRRREPVVIVVRTSRKHCGKVKARLTSARVWIRACPVSLHRPTFYQA